MLLNDKNLPRNTVFPEFGTGSLQKTRISQDILPVKGTISYRYNIRCIRDELASNLVVKAFMTSLESIFSGKRFFTCEDTGATSFLKTLSTYFQVITLNQLSPPFLQNIF